jgi:RNA polymerase primary sigma factor
VTWWIRLVIHRSLVNQGRRIRLPAHVDGELTHAQRALQDLGQELGRAPAPAERHERLGPAARKLVAHAGVIDRPISLETSVTDDATLADMLPDTSADDPSEIVERHLIASDLEDALSQSLNPREAQVIPLRYGLGGLRESTPAEIGAALGLTRERARQIEAVALRKLRCSAVVQRDFGIGAP